MSIEFQNRRRKYRYFLNNSSLGLKELYDVPEGWENAGFKWKRSETYWGLFRNYTAESFNFVKEGRRYLQQVEREQGIEAVVELIVKEYDLSTYEYTEIFRGEIDMASFVETILRFEVKVNDSDFENKIKTRDEINIKLTSTETLDGLTLPGFTNEGQHIVLPERRDFLFNTLKADESQIWYTTHAIALNVESNEDNAITSSPGGTNPTASAVSFYKNETGEDVQVNLNGIFGAIIDNESGYQRTLNARFQVYELGGFVRSVTIYTVTLEDREIVNPLISFDESILVEDGQWLTLVFGGIDVILSNYNIEFNANTQSGTIEETTLLTYLWHEKFTRILQSITNEITPFYSELLGRTDSENVDYNEDGELSLACTTNGKLIRGFTLEEAPLYANLKDSFDSINAIRPVGLGIETINGIKTARLEQREYFFDERVILTFDNANEITREAYPDLIFNKIKSGYDKAAYEEREGLLEYNNKSEWTNIISTIKNNIDNIAPYRADNAGITFARKLQKINKPTEDSQYDEDNFIINLVRGEASNRIQNGDFNLVQPDPLVNWTYQDVIVESILGNARAVIADNTSAYLQQSFTVNADDVLDISFVFNILGQQGLIAVAAEFQLILTDGVDTYYINSNGEWQESDSKALTGFVFPTNRSNIQGFYNYSKTTEAAPITGTCTLKYLGLNNYETLIDEVRIATSAKFKARTTEGFDVIENTINNTESYNIAWSPGRMLRNWGYIWRGFLEKHLNSYIRFSKSEKNSNMRSQLTGGDLIVENEDVIINDLDTPIWKAEKITFEAPVNIQTIQTLNGTFTADDKPKIYGIVKFRQTENDLYFYGYILSVEITGDKGTSSNNRTGQFEVLTVNTDYVTPIES
jgi:hypothetical protein